MHPCNHASSQVRSQTIAQLHTVIKRGGGGAGWLPLALAPCDHCHPMPTLGITYTHLQLLDVIRTMCYTVAGVSDMLFRGGRRGVVVGNKIMESEVPGAGDGDDMLMICFQVF